MRESGVLLNGTESCEVLILTLKADLIFCLYSCQLLLTLTDTSTFLEKKIQVEPFTCQSMLERSTLPPHPSPGDSMLLQPELVMGCVSTPELCHMCVNVGSFDHARM